VRRCRATPAPSPRRVGREQPDGHVHPGLPGRRSGRSRPSRTAASRRMPGRVRRRTVPGRRVRRRTVPGRTVLGRMAPIRSARPSRGGPTVPPGGQATSVGRLTSAGPVTGADSMTSAGAMTSRAPRPLRTGCSTMCRRPAWHRRVAGTIWPGMPIVRLSGRLTARRRRQCRGWLGVLPQNGARQEQRRAVTPCSASAGERAEV
jgi:hypothetical protein